ncbi:GTP-binding nuclear protein Ran [Pancytospora philotis]|nr:GTP-binding nuclear protein Ran [Pancytospora philotis]
MEYNNYNPNYAPPQPQMGASDDALIINSRNFAQAPNSRYYFKICLIGEGGTGKTTYINRALTGEFVPEYVATVGAVVRRLKLNIPNNSEIVYVVWDTAGQEKNSILKDGYYVNAVAGFFFFDVNSRESFSNMPKYINDFKNACNVENPLIFILGNKVDLSTKKKADVAKLLSLVKSHNVELVLISAKTRYNFDEPFFMLSRALFNDPNMLIEAKIDYTPLDINYDFLGGDDNGAVQADISNVAFDDKFN